MEFIKIMILELNFKFQLYKVLIPLVEQISLRDLKYQKRFKLISMESAHLVLINIQGRNWCEK